MTSVLARNRDRFPQIANYPALLVESLKSLVIRLVVLAGLNVTKLQGILRTLKIILMVSLQINIPAWSIDLL